MWQHGHGPLGASQTAGADQAGEDEFCCTTVALKDGEDRGKGGEDATLVRGRTIWTAHTYKRYGRSVLKQPQLAGRFFACYDIVGAG